MPAMTAREFANEIVEPTIREFMAVPDRRRGYLACIVSYHLGDYLGPNARSDAGKALGLPFLALERMCNAAKHQEATRGNVPPMVAGSDTPRLASGLDISSWDDLRFDDNGGIYVEHDGRQYDMLDLCLIAVRHYAGAFSRELSGSAITRIEVSTAAYPPA